MLSDRWQQAFDECVAAHQDVPNPQAYCAVVVSQQMLAEARAAAVGAVKYSDDQPRDEQGRFGEGSGGGGGSSGGDGGGGSGGGSSSGPSGIHAVPGGRETLAGLSAGEQAALRAGGVKYEVSDLPAGRHGYYDQYGRTVVVGKNSQPGTVAHETGHAIDNMLMKGGSPGAWFYSDTNAGFKAAVKNDLKGITAKSPARVKEYKKLIGKVYTKQQHNQEVFADLFATQRLGITTRGSYTAKDLKAAFPKASAHVRDLKVGG